MASRLQCGKPVCSTMTEMRNPEWLNYIYTLNRCTACRFGVYTFISSEQRVYWLAERQSLKVCTKIITSGNFHAQRECSTQPNRRSDQGAIYSQSLYIENDRVPRLIQYFKRTGLCKKCRQI